MASDFLRFQEDPSWGNIFSSIAKSISAAPKAALDQAHTAEEIKALRAKQIHDQAVYDANLAAGNAAAAALPSEPPTSTRTIPMAQQGPSNPNDPNTPLGEVFLPPTTAQETYVDPAVAARFKREQPFFKATALAQAFQNPAELPSVYAK